MPDDQTTPDVDSSSDPLAAFRSNPGDGNLFSELHKQLKSKGDLATLAELLQLRAAEEKEALRAGKHLAEAAEVLLELDDADGAEHAFRLALERDPAQTRAASHFCDFLIDRQRFAEAASVVEAEVEALTERAANKGKDKKGKEPFAARRAARHAVLAELWDKHLGRVERALHHWQQTFQLDPARTEALAAARAIYASLGNGGMVVRLYEAELEVLGEKGSKTSRAELLLELGRLQAKNRDSESAAKSLDEALRLDPRSMEAREALGNLYASPAFSEDTERRQRAASLFVDLGQDCLRKSETDAAVRYLRRALGVDPYSRSAANDLDKALSDAARWDELDRLYRHLQSTLTDEKDRIRLLERRCSLYREHLDDPEALKQALAELIQIPDAGPEHSVELRELYRAEEDWEELANLIEQEASVYDPNSREFAREMLELATIEREYLRNRDKAAAAIHQILQHNPRQEEALARYADHFRERRDWRGLADLGEFALEKLTEAGAPSKEVVRRLEELALLYEQRLGDIARAIGAWKRIQEIDAKSAKATEAIRRLSSREKTWQSLIGVLEQEAEQAQNPTERADALRRIAQTYRERHINPRRAIALYEEVLEMFPDDDAALKAVAELYDREGDEAGLAHTLRRQLELDARKLDRELKEQHGRAPTSREWPVSKRVERLNLLRRLAQMYEERVADVDGVVFACSGILEILPGDRDALTRMERVLDKAGDTTRLEQTLQYHAASASGPAERAKVLRKLAKLADDREDEVAAMERWEQVLGTVPSDKGALAALTVLYERHERWGELAGVLERRVLAPSVPDPGTPAAAARATQLRKYAQVVDDKLGDSGRALKAWRKLLDLLPKDRVALEALARLYEETGHWRELAEVLEEQVPLFLDSESDAAAAATLRRAAILEERLGAPADAAAALEHLIGEIDPSNLAGHKALRRLYEARGDFDSAVRIAEREIYLADEPKQKIARGLEIGFLCRDRLGDSPRALQAFERVLAIDSEHREALVAAADLHAKVGDWARHVALLEKQLEFVKAGRERRALMLRVAQTTAERLGDHKEAFLWYRRAHNHAPDPTTLAELRRAAEAYGLWRELTEVYEEEREALKNDEGLIDDKPTYVEFCREIAGVAERRLHDPARAVEAIKDALAVQPRSEALLSEAERIARESDDKDIWRAYLECLELPMVGRDRASKVVTLEQRARVLEERLDDSDGAMGELLKAFALLPDRGETQQAIAGLCDRRKKWDELLSIEAARFMRAPTREARIASLRRNAEVVENQIEDKVRAFRIHLSAFLLAPEDQETLAEVWRLAREIESYKEDQQLPGAEPGPAHVDPPEAARTTPVRRPRVVPAAASTKHDPTMELSISDLLAARDFVPAGDEQDPDTAVDEGEAGDTVDSEIAPPDVGDSTQEIDLGDLAVSEPAKPHAADPTMQLRTEDLIEALGARRRSEAPPVAEGRPTRPTKAPPPPPPPSPRIKRRRATAPPPLPGVAATKPAPVPRMPRRKYESPWNELSSAYELLPTPSPAMKLRWLFKSAEVQETGAKDIDRAFAILSKALDVAPDPGEAKDRLHRLAEEHDGWDRLADLYQQAGESSGTAEVAASYLLDVAEIRDRQGRPLETESIYRRILGMRPEDDEARSRLEKLYRKGERWVDLAASLEERTDPRLGSAAPEPERPQLLRELADVYQQRLSRPHDAIDALDRLRKLVPEDVSVLSDLAELHTELGRWSKVIGALQKIAEIDESSQDARDALHRVAEIYESKLELVDRAVDAYSQIVAQWPDDNRAYQALDRLFQAYGRWQELADVLRHRAALARDPEVRAELLGRRAKVLLEWLDNPDEAAAALRHARTIRSDDDTLADLLVTALAKAGREREAAAVLEGRIEGLRDKGDANPGTLAALLIRLAALRHEVMSDREGARTALDEALELVPNHPTALAAQARLVRDERDPRAYADALLKQVEAQDDVGANAQVLMEAGQVLRDECRDVEAARAAFEKVLELRPYHAEATWALAGLVEQVGELDSAADVLSTKLEDQSLTAEERAAILTQLAALARQAGVEAVAEHRLAEALEAAPKYTRAIIAKADLLFELERYADLNGFLAEVLPELEDAEPAIRADLRRRLASVYEKIERPDEAYQVLLEADRLHRGDVLIKLALGENRYRARRWREAALHLGALAEHPQAENFSGEVAEGLFHAALAEIRSLRPEKAAALYERAIELKPNYAPALHALAELAMEQGDSRRAADLLTRQANATTDPDERLRMFEALGDMAMMTLGDEGRARVCYDAAVQAASPLQNEHVPLLKKLLELHDLAGDSAGIARTAELLASFAEGSAERAIRLTMAAENYQQVGDIDRARDAAARAVDAAPFDLMAASIASELAMAREDLDGAVAILTRALGAKRDDEALSAPREALLYNRLGEARLGRNDRKGAAAAFESAIEVAPDSDGAMQARRGLLAMWKDSDETKERLVTYHRTLAADSRELEDIVAYGRAMSKAKQYDGARALLELGKVLGYELSEDDLVFMRKQPVRVMAPDEAYNGVLAEQLYRRVVGEADVALMSRVMATLWGSASLLFSDTETALAKAGLSSAERLTSSSNLPAAAIFTRIAKALKLPATLLYRSDEADQDVTIVCTSPPVVVLGPRLCVAEGDETLSDAELRFLLGRAAEMVRPENVIASGLPTEEFQELVDSLVSAFGGGEPSTGAKELKTSLPVRTRQPLTDLVGQATGADLDAGSYQQAVERTADRAGYLLCADAEVSLQLVRARGSKEGVRHLVEVALRPEFVEARGVLGVGVLR
ncbi:MAG: tetratricopeptide repeat protein [Deltaproteobacteria bacterium]|nr:tetratricopeptide repeat protein [Deltaproteobacteria bacterium]